MNLANIFGAIGLVCMILSVVSNDKIKILKYLKFKAIFYGLQYYFLGAASGCISMALGLVRAELIQRKEENPKIAKPIFAFLISMYTISSIVTYNSAVDIISILGNTAYLITLWFFKDIGIKFGLIVTVGIWMTYNCVVGAYAAVVSDAIVLVITVLYIVKYYANKKKEQ